MLDDVFLRRFREATEQFWATGHSGWQRGTRWTCDLDVDALERRTGARFPDEHRAFLAALHATSLPRRVDRYRGDELVSVDVPGFYHWIRDADAIAEARANVIGGLLFDVENNVLWPASWGPRPDDEQARASRVTELVGSAPTLFPILGHRFVVSGTPGLVLSIHQSDVVVYGANLREYLMNELSYAFPGEQRSSDYDTASIPFWGELVG